MPSYDLTITSPKLTTFIVTAFDDEAAVDLVRECLRLDYASESDSVAPASRIMLVARMSGQAVLDAQLVDLLQIAGGGGGEGA